MLHWSQITIIETFRFENEDKNENEHSEQACFWCHKHTLIQTERWNDGNDDKFDDDSGIHDIQR